MPVHHGDFFEGINKLEQTLRDLPTQIGAEALRFFQQGFKLQGWQGDGGLEPWDKRKYNIDPGRKILYGPETHQHLRDSLKKSVSGNDIRVEVTGSAAKYADAHNFGATIKIPVTAKMRKWAWAMFYKTKKDMYKGMALTKKSDITIKITKRQFIGNSKQRETISHQVFEYNINKAIPLA